MSFARRRILMLLAVLSLGLWACGDSDPAEEGSGDGESSASADGSGGRPTIVVTTNILGDVVENLVGDQADVVVVMPVGADPHDFQASAQQVAQMSDADALIVNGGDFEEGLLDVIEAAESDGVPTFEALSAVSTIEFGEDDHDDEADHDDHDSDEAGHDDHDDEADHDSDEAGHDDHDDEADHDSDEADHDDHDHGHDHSGADPHFFTDPARMAAAAEGIVDFLSGLDGVDAAALRTSADAYIADLVALDAEAEQALAAIPDDRRVMVTNHEVFGYFAERYGFEVVGTVVPGGSTSDGASAGALADLAELIEAEGVPAIFVDLSASDALAQTLADEVGDVAVVALYSESLGAADSDGGSYVEMVRTNVDRIATALQG